MHPGNLAINDFTYSLPEERIAKHPLAERDSSRLLIFRDKKIEEDRYVNIASYLPGGALLVFNDTKVVPARLLFRKETGGVVEILALEPHAACAGMDAAMNAKGNVQWQCLIGGAGKWKHGLVLQKKTVTEPYDVQLTAQVKERTADRFTIEFNWQPASLTFKEVLHHCGVMPIPPYLKRDTDLNDNNRYQTIYADHPGSVAAPTAGLHFSEPVFKSLGELSIDVDFVTLHVSAGTFMPVKSPFMEGHVMHAESLEVSAAFIEKLISRLHNVFAVGTTSLRTLESLYWMGLKCYLTPEITRKSLEISQWEVYTLEERAIDARAALNALLAWMKKNRMPALVCQTRILIAPGYKTKIIRGLITNFHQPNSTLLLLVAALIGKEWREVYQYALQNNFRFLSYGDGCLLYLP